MSKWLSVIVIVVAFFVIGAIVERLRVKRLDAWRRARGFTTIDPFVPGEHQMVAALAAKLANSNNVNSLRWAWAYAGKLGDTDVTLVEICYTPQGRKSSAWFTLATWPLTQRPGSCKGPHRPLAAWPHGGSLAVLDGHAGWITEGLLWPSRADQILLDLPEAVTQTAPPESGTAPITAAHVPN